MAQFLQSRGTSVATRVAAALMCSLAAQGCGSGYGDNLFLAGTPTTTCSHTDETQTATDVVLVDWSGGTSKLYGDANLAAIDLSRFEIPGGGNLADHDRQFKDAVVAETAAILCGMPGAAVHITDTKPALITEYTTVHIAQVYAPQTAGHIGEASFDPCNHDHADAAVIFAEELSRLGGPFAFDEWVLMFANVTAHEIGHTLGFGHVGRQQYDAGSRPLFVELMLATHTVPEMISPQRYLADESNCPADADTLRRRDVVDDACRIAIH